MIALVGMGRWGRNHARVLHELGALSLVCDEAPEVLEQARALFPGVRTAATLEEVAATGDVQGAVLATPAALHAAQARHLLASGKHVFVEKPLALGLADARSVLQAAADAGRVLQVGHVLEYHPARHRIREVLASGRLGRLLSARLVRVNLGTVRSVEDVLFSFAPHDIAFALELGGGLPETVAAHGFDLLERSCADTAVLVLEFGRPVRFRVQIVASWLEPRKEHRAILVGTDGMLEWNDTPGQRGLTLYRTGIAGEDPPRTVLEGTEQLEVEQGEPLRLELADFLDAIRTGRPPVSGGALALDVLAVLEAARSGIARGRRMSMKEITSGCFVHETAVVDPAARLGEGSRIWHCCHVMPGASIGRNVTLGQNCFVASNVRIGDGSRLQNNVSVYEGVELDEDVFVGPSAVFTNVRFPRASVSRKSEYEVTRVKQGATIGANATIVCGVTIERFAFVAAGAVVTRDVPPFTLVEGVPAVKSGYVCRCGERLKGTDWETAECRRCGGTYRRAGAGIEEVRDPFDSAQGRPGSGV